jgi:hypothetical protein
MQVGAVIGVVCALLSLAGCGGSSGGGIPPSVVSHILSNPRFDGDIEQTSPTSYTVTQGMSPSVQSVLAGIDPTARTEFRAFLNFPLGGSGGVPGNAIIDSAFLEVLVDNLIPSNGSVPIRVELVAFQPPTTDRNRLRSCRSAAIGSSAGRGRCDSHGHRLLRTGRRHFADDPSTATRLGGFSSADSGGSGSSELRLGGD